MNERENNLRSHIAYSNLISSRLSDWGYNPAFAAVSLFPASSL